MEVRWYKEILTIMVLSGIVESNFHNLEVMTYVVGFTGVKMVTVASDSAFEVHLQLSNLMEDIPISSLSDDNFYEIEESRGCFGGCSTHARLWNLSFIRGIKVASQGSYWVIFIYSSLLTCMSMKIQLQRARLAANEFVSVDFFAEEEFEDLHERIKAGYLKRSTILELETKAQVLHKDITKHWIDREVVLLQKRIDHANEKGWHNQLFEFLERKQLLQTKKEQDRLFSVMPKVVAEELAAEVKTLDAIEENVVERERENSCLPKSTPNGASDISGAA